MYEQLPAHCGLRREGLCSWRGHHLELEAVLIRLQARPSTMAYYVAILDGAGDFWGVRIPDLSGSLGGGPTPEAAIAEATSARPYRGSGNSRLFGITAGGNEGARAPRTRRVRTQIKPPRTGGVRGGE
jgi:hypothetical protein